MSTKSQNFKYLYKSTIVSCFLILIISSCKPSDYEIQLKWNKSYSDDTFDKNIIGLKWCFAYLGSELTSDSLSINFNPKDSIVHIDLRKMRFKPEAQTSLAILQQQLKQTEEYKKNKTIDLGRYIALTIGSSFNYYEIAGVPQQLQQYYERYALDTLKGYIDNSSISHVDRIISFSKEMTGNKQFYISAESDSITKEILEFETLEIMPNGLMKFGIYDSTGILKIGGDPKVTAAGKPAKCLWCHETGIQPLFRKQKDHLGYLTSKAFLDSLRLFDQRLRAFQKKTWKDKTILNRRLHVEMELSYIAFMEPSLEHISREWGIPLANVKNKLKHLKSHRHEEFDFLGDLYHRRDIDAIAPYKSLPVPESIREKSDHEVNNFTYSNYLDHFFNNSSFSLGE